MKPSSRFEGRVSIELGELAVVPITWRKESSALLRLVLFVDLVAVLGEGCPDGVIRKFQGPALILGLVGVRVIAIVHGL